MFIIFHKCASQSKKQCANYQMCKIVIKSIDKVKMHQHDKLDQKYLFITLMGFHIGFIKFMTCIAFHTF